MSGTGRILLELFIIYSGAKIAGELFERLHQPAVIGELLAGVLLGPSVLGWIGTGPVQETVASLGVVILLFAVGLETKVSSLFKVGRTAFSVAMLGVALPFAAGYGFMAALRYPVHVALFAGAALVATSVGITARVLADAGLISTRPAKIILAAAVIDDVLGLLVLAVVSGLGAGRVDVGRLAVVGAMALAFVAFQLLVAPRLVRANTAVIERLRINNAPLVVALVILLGLSALAERIGLAGIVGAFFAGMAFAETEDRWSLQTQTKPLYDFLVPFFFVLVGAQLDLRLLADPRVLVPGLALAALAILTKVLGCGVGALGEGRRVALAIGVGMVPRGEVGLIVASVGLAMGVVPKSVYAMVVLVSVITTVLVPPLVPRLFRPAPRA